MTDLGAIFVELGLSQYLDVFIDQGFDTWETILDITESDFDALGVKLGHRRKLQRRIANSRGISSDQALVPTRRDTPSEDRQLDETRGDPAKVQGGSASSKTGTGKRKYRRHPKPDENAPERPPSAYVIFSNKMREDLKGRNLSFTEIAKLVGENWQNLTPSEKEPYEAQAFAEKEKYNNELGEYKKTENYKSYSSYLAEFKAKQAAQQQNTSDDASKRPKLENKLSTESSGTGSSIVSLQGNEIPSRVRSISTSMYGGERSPPSQVGAVPNLVASRSQGSQGSPNATSPPVLPGYRDAIYGAVPPQNLPWRDTPRGTDPAQPVQQQLPRMMNPVGGDPRSGRVGSDSPNPFGPGSIAHRTSAGPTAGFTPPLLTTESTVKSSGSAASLFAPRTPMEPSLDRPQLPIPSLFQTKALYDNQLPPIRPPSLSPQSSLNMSYNSPGIPPLNPDHPSANPRRGPSAHPTEDAPLDPVSALLRAGEIVNRNDQSKTPPQNR